MFFDFDEIQGAATVWVESNPWKIFILSDHFEEN